MPLAMSSVATTSIVAKGYGTYIYGTVATASKPGELVFPIGSGDSFEVCNKTSDLHLMPYFVEFRFRTTSTFGEVDIDTDESAATADVKLLYPYTGSNDIEWWAVCTDPGAAVRSGTPYESGSAGGCYVAAAGHSQAIIGRLAPNYKAAQSDLVVKLVKP